MNYDDLPRFEKFRKRSHHLSNRKRRVFFPNCVHKAVYKTANLAQQVMAKQLRAGVPFLRIYRCPDCRFWHLTHHSS